MVGTVNTRIRLTHHEHCLVQAISALRTKSCRVLVTGPSNKAVQEIAIRYKQSRQERGLASKVALFGVSDKMSPDVQQLDALSLESDLATLVAAANDKHRKLKAVHRVLGSVEQPIADATEAALQLYRRVRHLMPNEEPLYQEILQLYTLMQLCQTSPDELNRHLPSTGITKTFDTDDVDKWLKRTGVVFATLAMTGSGRFRKLFCETWFHAMIVDEAAQALEAELLIPIAAVKPACCVLVGDVKQLPPIVISVAAQKAGFGRSTMSRLQKDNSQPALVLTGES